MGSPVWKGTSNQKKDFFLLDKDFFLLAMKILFLVLLVMATGYGVKITPLYMPPGWDYGKLTSRDQIHCQFVFRAQLHFGNKMSYWIPTMHKMYGGEDECIDWKEEKKLWKDIGMVWYGVGGDWKDTRTQKLLNGQLGDLISKRDGCIDMEENKYWIYHAMNDNIKRGCVHVMGRDWFFKNVELIEKKWTVKRNGNYIYCNRYGGYGSKVFGSSGWYKGCTPNFSPNVSSLAVFIKI